MGNFVDLTGKKFTRLTILERAEYHKNGSAWWKCICDCGNEIIVRSAVLNNGHTKSCGCLSSDITAKRNYRHGKGKHRFYGTWFMMIERCYNVERKEYEYYGKRGICVCDEWQNEPTAFLAWCDSKLPIPKGYTLDRIDNNKNYCPENCRFVSKKDQNRNMRRNVFVEYNGEKLVLWDFVKKYGVVSYQRVRDRVRCNKMNYVEAALTPLHYGRKT